MGGLIIHNFLKKVCTSLMIFFSLLKHRKSLQTEEV